MHLNLKMGTCGSADLRTGIMQIKLQISVRNLPTESDVQLTMQENDNGTTTSNY